MAGTSDGVYGQVAAWLGPADLAALEIACKGVVTFEHWDYLAREPDREVETRQRAGQFFGLDRDADWTYEALAAVGLRNPKSRL